MKLSLAAVAEAGPDAAGQDSPVLVSVVPRLRRSGGRKDTWLRVAESAQGEPPARPPNAQSLGTLGGSAPSERNTGKTMDNLKAAALIIGTLAEEAGIDESELPTITLVAFACRVVIARARKQAAARTVVAEPPCPFGDS